MTLCLICGEEIGINEATFKLISGKVGYDEFGGRNLDEIKTPTFNMYCHLDCAWNYIFGE